MFVYPPCTISPGAPVPKSITMATDAVPNRTRTNVPNASAIHSANSRLCISAPVRESIAQLSPSGVQIFRKHSRLADRRHEIGIAGPARHHVHMDVAGYTRTGGLADVHSEVITRGLVNGP